MARMVIMILCVMVTCMVWTAPYAEASVVCADVTAKLQPCYRYLTNGGTVPQECCGAIQELNALARTTADRQAICRCLTSVTSTVPGINLDVAANLPGLCGVNTGIEINPNVDCSRVR